MCEYPEYTTLRTACGRGRVTKDSNWSTMLPWCTYIDGTARKQFKDVYDAKQYFRSYDMILKEVK